MKGRKCIILARGKLNNCLIEFSDNRQMEVVSIRALRKYNRTSRKHLEKAMISRAVKKSPKKRLTAELLGLKNGD